MLRRDSLLNLKWRKRHGHIIENALGQMADGRAPSAVVEPLAAFHTVNVGGQEMRIELVLLRAKNDEAVCSDTTHGTVSNYA